MILPSFFPGFPGRVGTLLKHSGTGTRITITQEILNYIEKQSAENIFRGLFSYSIQLMLKLHEYHIYPS